MCNQWCLDFVLRCAAMCQWDNNTSVLEVGSLNVNGSPRDVIGGWVGHYWGVDIKDGPGVDQVCSVYDMTRNVPPLHSYDVVVSTEMLEHVEDWQLALLNMKLMLKEGGWLCLTTRSPGFEYHPYPLDCWRFTVENMKVIFGPPWQLAHLETDPDLRRGKYSGVGILAHYLPGAGGLFGWWQAMKTVQVAKPS